MDPIFLFIVVTLLVLAIFDLVVGVANDAVNFLNSALGSKIASRRVILSVAAIGILVGVLTSSGMMEVARSGVFYPERFAFREIMMLFLGMIVGDIILLDLFNSLGLPTSTTVSMVFGLLGAAVAVVLHRIWLDPALSFADMSQFINSGKAMAIIAAILLSVVLAFVFGSVVMYLSRLLFSFRYHKLFDRFGSLWCGISVTGIVYFALFKGLKGSGIISAQTIETVNNNIALSLTAVWALCSLLLFVLQRLKVNILKVTILSGTFALALAFAGNDLVNFIGVPLAGYDSYRLARQAGSDAIMMSGLNEPVRADTLVLLASGVVMVLTLFFNKKAMKVTQTELSLSSQNEGDEHFASSKLSRGLVRAAVATNGFYKHIVPAHLRERIDRRFEQLPVDERGDATYDLIRATVNLSAAAILISIATSLKLPLSTTYVVFMVAMGSSLADRAWGRETAVYRITGVFTVIAGWFVTALAAFTIALLTTSALVWFGRVAVFVVVALCLFIVIRSNFKRKKHSDDSNTSLDRLVASHNADDVLYACTEEVLVTMEHITRIYNRTLVGLFKENRKVLKTMCAESKELLDEARNRKYNVLSTLQQLRDNSINSGHFYVQVVDYLSEVTKALFHIVRPAFEHIDNNHEGLTKAQIVDLMRINDSVEEIFVKINDMLRTKDFSNIDRVLALRDRLFDQIAEAIKNQLQRINDPELRTPSRASMLYLDILSETKTMVLQARNLLKSQRYFVEHKDDGGQ